MTGRQKLAAAGAALALITGGGIAYAASSSTASCTSAPTITDGATTQSIRVTCSWPKPAPVTSTVTATVTQTVTAANSTTTTTTTPVATTTPPPTTTTTTAAPAAWPDASTTGVPDGVTLTPMAGTTVTTAGTVIDGKEIAGTLTINASNVTVKRSRITSSDWVVVKVADSATGVRLEDVTIDGKKAGAGSNGVYGPAAVLRADILGVENGMQPSDGGSIRDSWVHDLGAPGSPHIDGVQIDGARSDIVVEHNVIDLRGWTQTAAVMIDNYFGAIDRVTVNNNRLLGGGYTTYIDARFTSSPITNVAYTNNRIGYGQWGAGTISGTQSGRDSYTWSGNVDDATSNPIPAP